VLHSLGSTRSSLKPDHLLQTPDTFIRIPLPNSADVEFIVHTAPRLGAGFTQMTAEFAPNGNLGTPTPGIQRFIYILEGSLQLTHDKQNSKLEAGGFAFFPAGIPHRISAAESARAVIIEKRYLPLSSAVAPQQIIVGHESDATPEPLGGDNALQVRHMMPDGPAWDFAVNTMTYDPGAALSQVEIHVMEHGLLMLQGGGIYRLSDNWYPVTAGDFIWMAPYCPQWFGALGKTPAKYLIYKDWFRHPLGE